MSQSTDPDTVQERPAGGNAPWALIGIVTGLSGLAVSYLVTGAMALRLHPVTAVAELISRLTPGAVVEAAIQAVGAADKPLLLGGITVVVCGLLAWVGVRARTSEVVPLVVFLALAAVAVVATLTAADTGVADLVPVAAGLVTWVVVLRLLTAALRRTLDVPPVPSGRDSSPGARLVGARRRRDFLLLAGGVAAASGVAVVLGRVLGRGRARAEQARRLLRLPVTKPVVPDGAHPDVAGLEPWQTPADRFYLIDTAFTKPTVRPDEWQLRIHGMVERELVLTYDDLVQRELTEDWVTLNCVSNEVGGDLVGNAWWSGVRLDSILAEAGPLEGADAVLQTSYDGWTCGTPLSALTDGRNAMLAVAMNGQPLPIEHGFPVRTIVPGLYGYVSATKWLADMEVSTFDRVDAYWTQRGWGELGPVKMASRIDVPRAGTEVGAGTVVVAGAAWKQHTGIEAVEVALDGGAWQPAEVGASAGDDSWVQWRAGVQVEPGEHRLRVRAIAKDGEVQTGVVRDVLPDGATGWHEVTFTATGGDA
ncbi:MAG: oxidoreductase [Nocardioides sp.]|nr:oxidoreductase [Nocardioides sp.]